jgi:LysR family transcriptional regulator, glycine cleavage system transcriptional activator
MGRLLPSLDLLRGFEAAARHGSFTRAAQELFLTQSAVSRQVLALEEHLGRPLFERRHRQIELTDAGRKLFRATADAMRLLTDTAAEIQGSQGESVTVSCTMGFASLWLVPRLMDFRAECPGIDIRIAADNRIIDLERERVELAVRYCPADLAPPGATRLFGEEVFPVCAPGLRGPAGHGLAAPDDLRHHVLLEQEHAEVDHPAGAWAMWFEAMGLQRMKPAATLRFGHYDQLVQAAIDGQGVALGIGPLVRRHIAHKRLVAPFARRIATPRAYYLVTARRAAGRPEVAAFTSWLLRHASTERDAPATRRRRAAR